MFSCLARLREEDKNTLGDEQTHDSGNTHFVMRTLHDVIGALYLSTMHSSIRSIHGCALHLISQAHKPTTLSSKLQLLHCLNSSSYHSPSHDVLCSSDIQCIT